MRNAVNSMAQGFEISPVTEHSQTIDVRQVRSDSDCDGARCGADTRQRACTTADAWCNVIVIAQSPNSVTITYEIVHETSVIPAERILRTA